MQDIDQRDRELLAALQSEVPLVSTPFAVIGQRIDMAEKEVIKRAERLKREGIIKQISATFEPRAIGYRSCLVAVRVDDDSVDSAAEAINAHPGVTQNYRRNDDFNLWFTITIGSESRLGLDRTIEILADEAHAQVVRPLPTIRLFKTANLEMIDAHPADLDHGGIEETHGVPLTPIEIEAVRLLQRDLPLQPRPFDVLARVQATIGPDELLATARTLGERQQLRRFSATVAPRKPGFSATAMGVWTVPADKVDELGARMAAHRAVSHCYLRPTYDDWPYNLFTTVHARSVDECESIIHELAADTGLTGGRALYPIREYKRERATYFAPELQEWESARQGLSERTAVS
jgi:DNA-binding Lrp family transcriptional regulator